jgi:DNA primase
MKKIEKLIEINKSALQFFLASLDEHKEARDYLHKRLGEDTTIKFRLGYCPQTGLDWLENTDLRDAEGIGLITFDFDDKFNKVYRNVFSNRIMIPIYHARRLVGFGGRALDPDSEIKYLNSKNSVLYQKGQVLYGLDRAREHIYRAGYAIVVEGYFDVISLYSEGIKNCCAVCGSSLTKKQAMLLKRYTNKVFTLFDGDNSGKRAGTRAKERLEEIGIFGGTVILKRGYDPDTFIKKFGKKGLKRLPVIS